MQLPIVAPAPLVITHAHVFGDLFENRCQFHHFQNYLTGLIALDNKSLANMTRCVLESADKRTSPASSSKRPGSKTVSMTVGWRICSSRRKAVRGSKTDAALILQEPPLPL